VGCNQTLWAQMLCQTMLDRSKGRTSCESSIFSLSQHFLFLTQDEGCQLCQSTYPLIHRQNMPFVLKKRVDRSFYTMGLITVLHTPNGAPYMYCTTIKQIVYCCCYFIRHWNHLSREISQAKLLIQWITSLLVLKETYTS